VGLLLTRSVRDDEDGRGSDIRSEEPDHRGTRAEHVRGAWSAPRRDAVGPPGDEEGPSVRQRTPTSGVSWQGSSYIPHE
jgi:hypothetical protein